MTTTEQKTETKQSTKPDFGQGRFSAQMEIIYDDCQHMFGIEPAKAEKIARMAGSDAGAVFRNATANFTVGKVSGKENKVTIADASKVKGVTVTYPLLIVRAIQWFGEAGKNGIRFAQIIRLSEDVEQWIEEMEVKAS
jgi:hypothetical protein